MLTNHELLNGVIFGIIGAAAAYLEHRRVKDDGEKLLSLWERVVSIEVVLSQIDDRVEALEEVGDTPEPAKKKKVGRGK